MESFKHTWLPTWLLLPYGYVLPFLEVGLGVLLILGLIRTGFCRHCPALLLSLTFGQILLKNYQVVSNNMFHVAMAALPPLM